MVGTIITRITTDTNDSRKWALLAESFDEALIKDWTDSGFVYDDNDKNKSAKEWLKVMSEQSLPLEIQNANFFRWLRFDYDVALGKTSSAGTPVRATPGWFATLGNWDYLKKEYDFFVKDQQLPTPTITPNTTGTEGKYTGTTDKPKARVDFEIRKKQPAKLRAPGTNEDPVLALMGFVEGPWKETHVLKDWGVTVGTTNLKVITDAEVKLIEDRIKEDIDKSIMEGASKTGTYIDPFPASLVSPDFGGGTVRYNPLTKKYSLGEIKQFLADFLWEKETNEWVTKQETDQVANPTPIKRYVYLNNPTYIIHQNSSQRFIEWEQK